MSNDDDDNSTKSSKMVGVELPPVHDSERLDDAIRLKENCTARMGAAGLLDVARGRDHPDVQCIIDEPLELLPDLPSDKTDSAYASAVTVHVMT